MDNDLPVPAVLDDDTLRAEIEHTDEMEHSPWLPADPMQAEWAALKLIAAKDELDELLAEVDEYVRRVAAWAEAKRSTGRARELRRTIDYFRQRLEMFGRVTRELSPRDKDGEPTIKHVDLPSARIQTRVAGGTRAKFVVTDEGALMMWCLAHAPEFIVQRVDVAALEKAATGLADGTVLIAGGVVVRGMTFQPPGEQTITATVVLNDE